MKFPSEVDRRLAQRRALARQMAWDAGMPTGSQFPVPRALSELVGRLCAWFARGQKEASDYLKGGKQ